MSVGAVWPVEATYTWIETKRNSFDERDRHTTGGSAERGEPGLSGDRLIITICDGEGPENAGYVRRPARRRAELGPQLTGPARCRSV